MGSSAHDLLHGNVCWCCGKFLVLVSEKQRGPRYCVSCWENGRKMVVRKPRPIVPIKALKE